MLLVILNLYGGTRKLTQMFFHISLKELLNTRWIFEKANHVDACS